MPQTRTDQPCKKMKLSEDYTYGTNVIRAYSGDGIEVNDTAYQQSLIIAATQLIDDWQVRQVDDLSEQHWQQILEMNPEVIIIGTGEQIVFPHPSSYAAVIQQGIGIEFMDSMAACRTYNILLSEDRSVVAGIIL